VTEAPATLAVEWLPREPPLEPTAVAARGAAARALAARLLEEPDEALSTLRGVAGPDLILLIGETDSLPWADGVVYLGKDPSAPSLLLPTTLRHSVPGSLFEQALRSQFPSLATPIAVLPGGQQIVPVAEARTVDRPTLLAWSEGRLR
jgi:hypothetical protein